MRSKKKSNRFSPKFVGRGGIPPDPTSSLWKRLFRIGRFQVFPSVSSGIPSFARFGNKFFSSAQHLRISDVLRSRAKYGSSNGRSKPGICCCTRVSDFRSESATTPKRIFQHFFIPYYFVEEFYHYLEFLFFRFYFSKRG